MALYICINKQGNQLTTYDNDNYPNRRGNAKNNRYHHNIWSY
jgi:hypothetical protein